METVNYPWRNCWKIKVLEFLFVPIVFIFGVLPAILIANFFENISPEIIFQKCAGPLAIVYFVIVLASCLLLLNHVDNKVEQKWWANR